VIHFGFSFAVRSRRATPLRPRKAGKVGFASRAIGALAIPRRGETRRISSAEDGGVSRSRVESAQPLSSPPPFSPRRDHCARKLTLKLREVRKCVRVCAVNPSKSTRRSSTRGLGKTLASLFRLFVARLPRSRGASLSARRIGCILRLPDCRNLESLFFFFFRLRNILPVPLCQPSALRVHGCVFEMNTRRWAL